MDRAWARALRHGLKGSGSKARAQRLGLEIRLAQNRAFARPSLNLRLTKAEVQPPILVFRS